MMDAAHVSVCFLRAAAPLRVLVLGAGRWVPGGVCAQEFIDMYRDVLMVFAYLAAAATISSILLLLADHRDGGWLSSCPHHVPNRACCLEHVDRSSRVASTCSASALPCRAPH